MVRSRNMGEIKQLIQERYELNRRKAQSPGIADKYPDATQKLIYGILADFGIDFPIDFIHKPPEVDDVSREGTFFVPAGRCVQFTFQARDRGFLVIDFLDFAFEDPIANDFVRVTYLFNETARASNFQLNKAAIEPGHWKFNGNVLIDGDSLTVNVCNTHQYCQAVVTIEADMWHL